MAKNGNTHAVKKTRHIDTSYSFITDRIEKKEGFIEHFPTEEMIEDFFSKPLQGSLFRKFRDIIMNLEDWYQPKNMWDHRSVLGKFTTL